MSQHTQALAVILGTTLAVCTLIPAAALLRRPLVRMWRAWGGSVLAVVIGLAGAIALSHWSVCEQWDRACLVSGGAR